MLYIKRCVSGIAVAAVIVTGLFFTNHSIVLADSIDPGMLVQLANADRTAHGLSNLAINPVLEKAAMEKAQDMAAHEYFSHTSPTGVTPWHWFDDAGYSYTYAGENLAIDFSDSASVETAWMNSLHHRENILNGHYTEIGIAAYKGTYQGHETVYIVQLFGRPQTPPTETPSTATSLVAKPVTTSAVLASTQVLGLSTKKIFKKKKKVTLARAR